MGGKRTAKKTGPAKSSSETNDEAGAVVQLPADCRLAAQSAMKTQLEGVLHQGDVVLDVSRLERIDTAALQLLVLFRRELARHGGALQWRGANEILYEAAGLLGLEQLLNLPAATPA